LIAPYFSFFKPSLKNWVEIQPFPCLLLCSKLPLDALWYAEKNQKIQKGTAPSKLFSTSNLTSVFFVPKSGTKKFLQLQSPCPLDCFGPHFRCTLRLSAQNWW